MQSSYLQTGLLWCQVGAPANCAELQRGHGAADVQILPRGARSLHQGDAVGAAHSLSWILLENEAQVRFMQGTPLNTSVGVMI